MTPDQRRRLRLAGAAAAIELLAWKAEVWDRPAEPELLEAGAARASAALRAVLGAAREPTAPHWYVELEITPAPPFGKGPPFAGPVLRPHLVAELTLEQLGDDDLAAISAELGAGFRDHAAPAYLAELEQLRARGVIR